MVKVMHVDTVFEVYILNFFFFGYFFYARRGAYRYQYLMKVFKTLFYNPQTPISGESSTKLSYLGPPLTKYIDLTLVTALNAGIR